MKLTELENYLRDAPETGARVSERQHNDVMRAVRLAGQSGKRSMTSWAKPALGATLAATAMLVFYVTQSPRPVPPSPAESPLAPAGMTLTSLGDRLRAIPISVEAALPEKELELELERLKSDLKRFGLKS